MILEVYWDGLWTLSFGLSQFHGYGSWLMCEVAGPKHVQNKLVQNLSKVSRVTFRLIKTWEPLQNSKRHLGNLSGHHQSVDFVHHLQFTDMLYHSELCILMNSY